VVTEEETAKDKKLFRIAVTDGQDAEFLAAERNLFFTELTGDTAGI
jgi:hypothetical protein